MKEKPLDTLNSLLVETFNAILKVEERSLRTATRDKVTVTEMHILDAIGEGCTVSELAAASLVTASTMTIAVNRLEAKKLVERVRDAGDRRVVRVILTDAGRSIAYAHHRFHRRMARDVAKSLTAEELSILVRAMANLRTFFEQESQAASQLENVSLDEGRP